MHITINSKDTLNAFVKTVANETKLSPSRLKGAIARAYKFDHITPFEKALSANTLLTLDCLEVTQKEQNVKQELILDEGQLVSKSLALAEVNSVDELSFSDYERSEDSILFNVQELLAHNDLPRALAIIELLGLGSVSELIKSTLFDSQLNSYLQNNT